MSKKPGRAGAGGKAKARPKRPAKPASHAKASKAKPARPVPPHGSRAHAGTGKQTKATKTHQTGGHAAKSGGSAKRGFSLGTCSCAAEALAASLRLAGFEVSDHDVLDLYYLTANDPDEGASIEATLQAATECGLAGVRLDSYFTLPHNLQYGASLFPLILGVDLPGPHTVYDAAGVWWSWGQPYRPFRGATIEEAWKLTWELPGRML